MSFVCQLDRFDAKTCAENAIKRSGRTATLQMPKHATARLLSSALRNLARDNFADSSKSKFAVLGLAFYLLTIFGSSAFFYNNERADITGGVTRFDRSRDSVVIERDFRNQNNIGASCDSRRYAIQPAWRPITSITITRFKTKAVVCSRSHASITAWTAGSNPNVIAVASRSLSMV
jgi:hypothetical protein